jgi:hypothetical protein
MGIIDDAPPGRKCGLKLLWIVKNFPPSMGAVQQYAFHYIQNMRPSSCVVLTRNQGNADKEGSST